MILSKPLKVSVFIAAVLAVLIGVGYLFIDKDGLENLIAISGKSCPQDLNLDRFPIDLTDDVMLVPLGNLNPSGHTYPTRHIYVQSNLENPGSRDLYAPSDITITDISLLENITENHKDYSITYKVCGEVEGYFIHVDELDSSITSQFSENMFNDCEYQKHGTNQYKQCFDEAKIELKSGDRIGRVWKTQYNSFDIGFSDYRAKPHMPANPDRREGDVEYATCIVDYYPQSMKDELNKRFESWDGGQVTGDNPCNRVVQDVSGTAQGVWANKAMEEQSEEYGIALVDNNFDTSLQSFSIGKSFEDKGFKPVALTFKPETTGIKNVRFDKVEPDGKTYCYDNFEDMGPKSDVSILIKMIDNKTIKMEMQNIDSCKNDLSFSSDSIVFVR